MTEQQITIIVNALGSNLTNYTIYKDRVVFQVKNERQAVESIAPLLWNSYRWSIVRNQLTIYNA